MSRVLTVLFLGVCAAPIRADLIGYEATGVITWVEGATAARPLQPGMPFRVHLWFHQGADSLLWTDQASLWSSLTIGFPGMPFDTGVSWWEFHARRDLLSMGISDPTAPEGGMAMAKWQTRIEGFTARHTGSGQWDSFFVQLDFRHTWKGAPWSPMPWLMDLEQTWLAGSSAEVRATNWAESRLHFRADFTAVRRLEHLTPEPGALVLAGLGAVLTLLARRGRGSRQTLTP